MPSGHATPSLIGALLGAGTLALFGGDLVSTSVSSSARAERDVAEPAAVLADVAANRAPVTPPSAVHGGAPAAPSTAELLPATDAPAITWKAPAAWATAPNSSSMRIATYKIAHALADAEHAEMSVVRAGGSVEANIARWREQFEGASEESRETKMVRGLSVTIVEMRGTFLGGGGGAAANRPGWTLLAAIVETSPMPYFFKLTGPTATVRSARADFDALVGSLIVAGPAAAAAAPPEAK